MPKKTSTRKTAKTATRKTRTRPSATPRASARAKDIETAVLMLPYLETIGQGKPDDENVERVARMSDFIAAHYATEAAGLFPSHAFLRQLATHVDPALAKTLDLGNLKGRIPADVRKMLQEFADTRGGLMAVVGAFAGMWVGARLVAEAATNGPRAVGPDTGALLGWAFTRRLAEKMLVTGGGAR